MLFRQRTGSIQEDPKPICVATYVTSTAMTVSYPTATLGSGQRIAVNGRASSFRTHGSAEGKQDERTGISSFQLLLLYGSGRSDRLQLGSVRIMIPKAPPTTIRNAMISMAELLIIPVIHVIENPVPPSPLNSATPSVTGFLQHRSDTEASVFDDGTGLSTPFIRYVTSSIRNSLSGRGRS